MINAPLSEYVRLLSRTQLAGHQRLLPPKSHSGSGEANLKYSPPSWLLTRECVTHDVASLTHTSMFYFGPHATHRRGPIFFCYSHVIIVTPLHRQKYSHCLGPFMRKHTARAWPQIIPFHPIILILLTLLDGRQVFSQYWSPRTIP
jgi:hypothetical protein